MKKFISIIFAILILFSGCTREKQFGTQDFVDRMNKDFGYKLKAEEFMLGKSQEDKRYYFYRNGDTLISLFPNEDNKIIGISLVITNQADISHSINTFTEMCSVFTCSDKQKQQSTLNDCKINSNNIKFADSTLVSTVGKFKYTVVCTGLGITMFCERA